jgi:tungstate transport system ATP-binding protein
MDTPRYRLRDVLVRFGGRTVLDVPALEVRRGRVTAIVGPNGAGKTTLLRVLAFLLAPDAGTVEFDGEVVSFREPALGRVRRQTTLVAQSPLLFHRSVRANVAYGLRARGHTAEGIVDAALARVGLHGFAERSAWKLSGGESQRVAVARALAIDPPVYLLDELTGNVDREHAAAIEEVIAALGAAGKTVVVTTHDIEQAYRLSDTVLSVIGGRIGSTPLVNVLRGSTVRIGSESYFDTHGLRIEIADGSAPSVIAVDPEDIILSCERLHSSARNCCAGTMVKAARDGASVVVTVDCGQPLVARITQHSYDELELNIGARVWLTFKSSAIHVLTRASLR